MKKKLFISYLFILFVLLIFIISASFLANKTRVGYLNVNLNLNKTIEINSLSEEYNNLKENEKINIIKINANEYYYDCRMEFYDKIFRYSDIFSLIIDSNKKPDYVKSINMQTGGRRAGYIISTKIIDDKKIDNIYYKLRIKPIYYSILIIMIGVLIIFNTNVVNIIFKKFNKDIEIKIYIIIILGYLYLIIPFIIFVFSWTKYIVSIPIIIVIFYILYLMIKDSVINYNKVYSINIIIFVIMIVSIILFVLVSGIGEIFEQSIDMIRGRNPIFRDLINFSWPVIYTKSGYAIVYYIAHWIVPAIFGKCFGLGVGNIVLVLWSSIGIFIAIVLVLYYLNINSNKYILIALLLFIFFSPIAEIHSFSNRILSYYSSHLQDLQLLFNQAIAIWVMSSLFLVQRNSSNFAFLGLSVILYSPYAVIGILPYMIVKTLIDLKENLLITIKNIFSLKNILSSITIFPLLMFYFSSNSVGASSSLRFLLSEYNALEFLYFYILAFGVHLFLIFKNNKNNYIYYVSIFMLFAVASIMYGPDQNFHRVNITAIFFVYVLVVDYLNKNSNIKSIKKNILIFMLILSSLASLTSISNSISYFVYGGVTKELGRETFNTDKSDFVLNTITSKDLDKSIFFKYIAKNKK